MAPGCPGARPWSRGAPRSRGRGPGTCRWGSAPPHCPAPPLGSLWPGRVWTSCCGQGWVSCLDWFGRAASSCNTAGVLAAGCWCWWWWGEPHLDTAHLTKHQSEDRLEALRTLRDSAGLSDCWRGWCGEAGGLSGERRESEGQDYHCGLAVALARRSHHYWTGVTCQQVETRPARARPGCGPANQGPGLARADQ